MFKVKSIDDYIFKFPYWKNLIENLITISKKLGVNVEIKRGSPDFVFKNKNMVGFAVSKKHWALWFFQGVLMKDRHKKLVSAQEGETKTLLQWRIEKPKDFFNDKEGTCRVLY